MAYRAYRSRSDDFLSGLFGAGRNADDPERQALAYAPQEPEATIVSFPFVTTRERLKVAKIASFSGVRSPGATYGVARVSVPRAHKFGDIELPRKLSLFGLNFDESADDNKHFSIKTIDLQSKEDFYRHLYDENWDQILIFVHGFNTTFDDACYRTAQIIFDIQYKGLTSLFSWASNGNISDYEYDQNSTYLAEDELISFIRTISIGNPGKKINILAHSMGNLLVLNALSRSAASANPVSIENLIMAAPDVDRDRFLMLVPAVQKITGHMTLYASSADRALLASKILAHNPRAGDVMEGGPIILPNLETVDVTALGDEFLGLNHGVFSTAKSIMSDMRLLLTGALPPRLSDVRAVPPPPDPGRYWRYVR